MPVYLGILKNQRTFQKDTVIPRFVLDFDKAIAEQSIKLNYCFWWTQHLFGKIFVCASICQLMQHLKLLLFHLTIETIYLFLIHFPWTVIQFWPKIFYKALDCGSYFQIKSSWLQDVIRFGIVEPTIWKKTVITSRRVQPSTFIK